MERIEDRSKALSYIGIEIAEALKYIPAPIEDFVQNEDKVEENVANITTQEEKKVENKAVKEEKKQNIQNAEVKEVKSAIISTPAVEEASQEEQAAFIEETRFEAKPSLWQRIKNSKFVRTIKYIMQIKVVLDYPALPEGREN